MMFHVFNFAHFLHFLEKSAQKSLMIFRTSLELFGHFFLKSAKVQKVHKIDNSFVIYKRQ